MTMASQRNWTIFFCSVFFVLGFSLIFSLLGALLQSVLVSFAYETQQWLGRIGGIIIILFGISLLGLISIPFLNTEHKLLVKKRFQSAYLTSFLFGAAFAIGWTPCVGSVLGAVLTLAITQPTGAFFLLLAYSLGLGLPFLLLGLFTNKAQSLLQTVNPWLKYLQIFFGIILIGVGILVFTNQLGKLANFALASDVLLRLESSTLSLDSGASVTLGIAFFAGLVSFLSPCVLPILPGFLSYLASIAVKKE
ncbi:cytochrome C biogenesis protein [Candidatus Woesearchaeota archaeon]|nr:cytochrome C biogenesis protein [Candidatus Woesearchaeota archaeon]